MLGMFFCVKDRSEYPETMQAYGACERVAADGLTRNDM